MERLTRLERSCVTTTGPAVPQNPQSGTGPVVPIFAELSARKSSPRRRLAAAPGGCYNLYIKKKQEGIIYGTTTNGPGAENHKKSYL